jgi:DNA-binding LacI/PurR family transcriptional regulator
MVTITDVAKRAGVSISTVSNVINKNKYVSDELVRRVNMAVQELSYSANPIAQKMKFKRTKTIGVIVADLCGLFYPYILKGMYNVLNSKGYRLIVMDIEGAHNGLGSIKKFQEGITSLIHDRVDGIVFSSTIPEETEAGIIHDIMKLPFLQKNTGFVCVEKDLGKYGIDSVYANSEAGAEIAVSHLVEVGCRQIGHITGPVFFTIAQDRITGYKNVMRRNGLEIDDAKMISCGDYTHKSGYLAMKDLMYKMPKIDGVFIANDQMAVGAMKAISEEGRKIPDDIKVIGYDDVFIASVLEPSLSTIHIKKNFTGQKAAELLLEQLEQNENIARGITVEIEPKLVIRRSTVKEALDDWILMDW